MMSSRPLGLSPVDLAALARPEVIASLDVEALFEAKRARLIAAMPELASALALESDPLVKLLQVCAYDELLVRADMNDGARSVMLAFATGAALDHLGALLGVTRLTIQAADVVANVAAIYESDSDFRGRIQMAPETWTGAGPRLSYVARALAAHPDVADASVISPSPATVTVTVLSRSGNGTPSLEVLAAIRLSLNADDARPIADRVIVQVPQLMDVTVEAAITILAGASPQNVMVEAGKSLVAYLASQRRLGGDITISGLMAALHIGGVHRVVVTSPSADLLLTATQAPRIVSSTLTLGGLDA